MNKTFQVEAILNKKISVYKVHSPVRNNTNKINIIIKENTKKLISKNNLVSLTNNINNINKQVALEEHKLLSISKILLKAMLVVISTIVQTNKLLIKWLIHF